MNSNCGEREENVVEQTWNWIYFNLCNSQNRAYIDTMKLGYAAQLEYGIVLQQREKIDGNRIKRTTRKKN